MDDNIVVNIHYNGKVICICRKEYLDFVLYGLTLKLDDEKLFCEYEDLSVDVEDFE